MSFTCGPHGWRHENEPCPKCLFDKPKKDQPRQPTFDHPCKGTCSGWQQGYDRGFSEGVKSKAGAMK